MMAISANEVMLGNGVRQHISVCGVSDLDSCQICGQGWSIAVNSANI